MALTTSNIAIMIELVEGEKPKPPALQVLHILLLKSLSPNQRKFYDLVLAEDSVTSHTCVAHFGCTNNYAGNVLKSLHDLGLLKRGWEDGNRHIMVYEVLERRLGYDEMEVS